MGRSRNRNRSKKAIAGRVNAFEQDKLDNVTQTNNQEMKNTNKFRNNENVNSGFETNFYKWSRYEINSYRNNQDRNYGYGACDEKRHYEYKNDGSNDVDKSNSNEANNDAKDSYHGSNNRFGRNWRGRQRGSRNCNNRDNADRNDENSFRRYNKNFSYKRDIERNNFNDPARNREDGTNFQYVDHDKEGEVSGKDKSSEFKHHESLDPLKPDLVVQNNEKNKQVTNAETKIDKDGSKNLAMSAVDEKNESKIIENSKEKNLSNSVSVQSHKVNSSQSVKNIKLSLPLPSIKIKKEPHSNSENKSNSDSSFDSESSSSTSSDDSSNSKDKKKPKSKESKKVGNVPEEEIVYVGKVKNFQNLVEDDISNESRKSCILCDKVGHTSFECFMECKNCGEKYHNLKMCPKPANLSIMLQNFMEFCLQQCYQYNPEHKFTFIRDNLATELIPGLNQTRFLIDNNSNSGSMLKKTSKRKRKTKESETSDSESSSSSANISKTKKKKKKKQMQYPLPYFPMTPSPFNPLAAAAMMGFNPAAYMGKKE